MHMYDYPEYGPVEAELMMFLDEQEDLAEQDREFGYEYN